MARLTSAERYSKACHIMWDEWGAQFGFKLYGANNEAYGHFILPDGGEFVVPKAAREAISAALIGR